MTLQERSPGTEGAAAGITHTEVNARPHPTRVLVLDGNENQAVAATRSLARAGHKVSVGATTSWSKAGLSRFAHDTFRYPDPRRGASAFVAAIADQISKCRSEQGVVVLPMTERATIPLSLAREAIEQAGGTLILPAHQILSRAFDKQQTLDLAAKLGIILPKTLALETADEPDAANLPYPVVLKPRSSQEMTGGPGGAGLRATGQPRYARNAEEFRRAFAHMRERCNSILVQEFVEGDGVGFFALVHHGNILLEFAHRRIRDVRPTGSGSALRESITPSPQLARAARDLLHALQWHGVAMVEFRQRPDGTPVLMEINGRFWNSLALAVHAGADFPAKLVEMAQTGTITPPAPYRPGVKCRWFFGDCRHLLAVWKGLPASFPGKRPSRLGTLARVLCPIPGAYHDNFALNDPMPELGDWLDFFFTACPNFSAGARMNGLLGILHAHSTYSDGEFTLRELRDEYLAQGCRFLCITDHAEFFDELSIAKYVAECVALSDDKFLFIPGLEYDCPGKLHILGYGVTDLLKTRVPSEVIREIRARGGVAVVAHPKDAQFDEIEKFTELPDGIETWNSKYDGQFAPRVQTFDLLSRMQAKESSMRAFFGQDLHWRTQFRGLLNAVDAPPNRAAILDALREGAFEGRIGDLVVASTGLLSADLRERFAASHRRHSTLKRFLRRGKKLLDYCRVPVPKSVKNQFRRMF